MVNRQQTCKPFQFVTSHLGQLSLAIPPCVSSVHICESGA